MSLLPAGCSRAPAGAAVPGGGGAPALRLTPAPGSGLTSKDLPTHEALADLLARALAPAGLRPRTVTAEAGPATSPFGDLGGAGTILAVRGQIEAETSETLLRAEGMDQAELVSHGLAPGGQGSTDPVLRAPAPGDAPGSDYDPQRAGGPLASAVFLRPVAPAGQRVTLLFEVLAKRFGPGRYEWSPVDLNPDGGSTSGSGGEAPALNLNLRGLRFGQPGVAAFANAGTGLDLPRGAFGPAAILRGSEQEAALWTAELQVKAQAETRAAAARVELARREAELRRLLMQALGAGATYRGPWRARVPAAPAAPTALEFAIEQFDPASGALRARLRRVDPGPPGPLTMTFAGQVDLGDLRRAASGVGKAAAGGSNTDGQGGGGAAAVRLPELRFQLRATNAAPIRPDPQRGEMTPATPFGSRGSIIEFSLTQEDAPGPTAGGGAAVGAGRFTLRGEEQAIMVHTDFVAPQVAVGSVPPLAPAP